TWSLCRICVLGCNNHRSPLTFHHSLLLAPRPSTRVGGIRTLTSSLKRRARCRYATTLNSVAACVSRIRSWQVPVVGHGACVSPKTRHAGCVSYGSSP